MSSRFSGGYGSGGGGTSSSSSSSMVVAAVEDSMVEENFAAGCILVEPIVERMLSDRVAVGMIQQETKSKIKAAIEKRILFPNNHNNESTTTNTTTNTNTSSSRSSKRYTMSPILKYMDERGSSDDGGGGTIYVAYVPKGMGKTTACYAFAQTATAINENSRQTKNNTNVLALLASSPPTTDGSGGTSTGATFPTCLESMVSLFSLRWGALPLGFVTTLIQSLIISEKKTLMERIIGRRRKNNNKHNSKNTRSYLILDEFMSNGINTSDEKLVLHIKKLIQDTNVCVFLLTSNQESANYLLTLNNDNDNDIINNNNSNNNDVDGGGGGGGIQPLVESSVLARIRRQRSQQQQQLVAPNNNNNNNSIPSFDWDLYCCMEWTEEQIQDAIVGYNEFVDADTETQHLQKNSNAALSLSDMDATYFELEQAALERSLQSYSQNENEKKQRASTSSTSSSSSSSYCTTSNKSNSSSSSSFSKHQIKQGGDHKAPAVASAAAASISSTNTQQAASISNVASLPCHFPASVASVPPAAAFAASVAAAASSSSSSSRSESPQQHQQHGQKLRTGEEYPSSVQELVMNGFTLNTVIRAYDLVGDNFDDMLSILLSNNTMS